MTLRGTVTEKPRKRGRISGGVYFRRDLSIRLPHDAQYRVDDGAWQPLAAVDGAFDEPSEVWTLITDTLPPGHHKLELAATTGEAAVLARDLGRRDARRPRARHQRGVHQEHRDGKGRQGSPHLRAEARAFPGACRAPPRPLQHGPRRAWPTSVGMTTFGTGEDGVWAGTIKPARTRTFTSCGSPAPAICTAFPVVLPRITVKVQ